MVTKDIATSISDAYFVTVIAIVSNPHLLHHPASQGDFVYKSFRELITGACGRQTSSGDVVEVLSVREQREMCPVFPTPGERHGGTLSSDRCQLIVAAVKIRISPTC